MDVVDHLIEPPGDPVPPGARVGIVTTADGVRLRWASFAAPSPRGTVILLQGRAEYIERWYETVRDLQARGLSVLAFDWRGQGGSQRLAGHPRKGHVPTFAAYDFDLDAVLRLVAPALPRPWYVLAHSTGGLIAVANGARLRRDVRRMVTTAPFFGLGDAIGPAEPVTRFLAKLLAGLGFRRDWVPGGGATPIHTIPFARNWLTSDPERHARGAEMSWRHPEVAIGSPTVGWLASAFEAIDRVLAPEALSAWRLPTLIFACGDDRVVSNPAIERFATRTVATDLIVVPGARHELLMERDRFREQFWAAFDAFVPGSGAPAVTLVTPPVPEPTPPTPVETPVAAPAEPAGAAESDAAASLAAVAALAAVTAVAASGTSESAPITVAEAEPTSVGEGDEAQDLVVDAPVAGGDDTTAVDGAAAGPVGDDAAGALDHRDQGDDVVGLQPRLDDHVDEARGDHAVGVAVDPVARQPDP